MPQALPCRSHALVAREARLRLPEAIKYKQDRPRRERSRADQGQKTLVCHITNCVLGRRLTLLYPTQRSKWECFSINEASTSSAEIYHASTSIWIHFVAFMAGPFTADRPLMESLCPMLDVDEVYRCRKLSFN